MARKRHTVERIVQGLRESEVALAQGRTVKAICKQDEVTEQTYHRWRRDIISRICGQLRPGGFLVLGHSETTNGLDLPLVPVAPTAYRYEP